MEIFLGSHKTSLISNFFTKFIKTEYRQETVPNFLLNFTTFPTSLPIKSKF